MTTVGLCETRPYQWWDTGDPGNRLALALCRVCPARDGSTCLAGQADQRPAGVIRAGVAFNERGRRCDICAVCGYPVDDVLAPSRIPPGCRHCRVPRLRSWSRTFMTRQTYFAACYQRRKAAAVGAGPIREETRA